ncbi:MAG: DUF3575 domain-containing protein [Bacteroidia bacterium]|nr:DUF3575 domain-containing protein [Bacteroidia bacterium]
MTSRLVHLLLLPLIAGFACLSTPVRAQGPSRFLVVKTNLNQYLVPEVNLSLEKSIGSANSIEVRGTWITRGIWAAHETLDPFWGIFAGMTADRGWALEAGYRRYFMEEIFVQATLRYRTWTNQNFVHSLPSPSGNPGERVYQMENITTRIEGFKITSGAISGYNYPGGVLEASVGLGIKFIHRETYAWNRSPSPTLFPPDPTFGSYTEIRNSVLPSVHFSINMGINFKQKEKQDNPGKNP